MFCVKVHSPPRGLNFFKDFSYQYNKVSAHPAKMCFLIIKNLCVKMIVQTQSFSKTDKVEILKKICLNDLGFVKFKVIIN